MGIGALMNARGLMELIIINIGLQKGTIGSTLFSMMVLVAIITTVMAGPLFEIVYGRKARETGELGQLGPGGRPQAPQGDARTEVQPACTHIAAAPPFIGSIIARCAGTSL